MFLRGILLATECSKNSFRYILPVAFFALTTAHGPNWDAKRGIRQQDAWDEHASFMDGLVDEGLVVLGGPLAGGERALLLIEASDESEIRSRLSADPWADMGLLQIGSIEPWSIWLDGRQASAAKDATV